MSRIILGEFLFSQRFDSLKSHKDLFFIIFPSMQAMRGVVVGAVFFLLNRAKNNRYILNLNHLSRRLRQNDEGRAQSQTHTEVSNSFVDLT